MERETLIAALRRMQVETGSLVCLGCEYEHNCGVHGCVVLKRAADLLDPAVDITTPIPLDRLRELAEADRDGRCVVLPDGGCTDKDGENALKSAMNTVYAGGEPVETALRVEVKDTTAAAKAVDLAADWYA